MKGLLIAAWLPATVFAQTAPQSVRVVVPVVGSVIGANEVHWRTALELINDSRSEVTVAVTLMTAPDQPALLTTIGPGDHIAFTDVVTEAFGADAILSPLSLLPHMVTLFLSPTYCQTIRSSFIKWVLVWYRFLACRKLMRSKGLRDRLGESMCGYGKSAEGMFASIFCAI